MNTTSTFGAPEVQKVAMPGDPKPSTSLFGSFSQTQTQMQTPQMQKQKHVFGQTTQVPEQENKKKVRFAFGEPSAPMHPVQNTVQNNNATAAASSQPTQAFTPTQQPVPAATMHTPPQAFTTIQQPAATAPMCVPQQATASPSPYPPINQATAVQCIDEGYNSAPSSPQQCNINTNTINIYACTPEEKDYLYRQFFGSLHPLDIIYEANRKYDACEGDRDLCREQGEQVLREKKQLQMESKKLEVVLKRKQAEVEEKVAELGTANGELEKARTEAVEWETAMNKSKGDIESWRRHCEDGEADLRKRVDVVQRREWACEGMERKSSDLQEEVDSHLATIDSLKAEIDGQDDEVGLRAQMNQAETRAYEAEKQCRLLLRCCKSVRSKHLAFEDMEARNATLAADLARKTLDDELKGKRLVYAHDTIVTRDQQIKHLQAGFFDEAAQIQKELDDARKTHAAELTAKDAALEKISAKNHRIVNESEKAQQQWLKEKAQMQAAFEKEKKEKKEKKELIDEHANALKASQDAFAKEREEMKEEISRLQTLADAGTLSTLKQGDASKSQGDASKDPTTQITAELRKTGVEDTSSNETIVKLENEIQVLKAEHTSLSASLESERTSSGASINELRKNVTDLTAQNTALNNTLESERTSRASNEAQFNNELNDLKLQNNELKSTLESERTLAGASNNDLQKRVTDLTHQNTTLTNELESERSSHNTDRETAEQAFSSLRTQVFALTTERDNALSSNEHIQNELATCKIQTTHLTQQLEDERASHEGTKLSAQKTQEALDAEAREQSNKITELQHELLRTTSQKNAAYGMRLTLQRTIAQKISIIQAQDGKIVKLEDELDGAQKQCCDAMRENQQLRSNVRSDTEEALRIELATRAERHADEVDNLKAAHVALEEDSDEKQQKLLSLEADFHAKTEELEELRVTKNKEISQLKVQIRELKTSGPGAFDYEKNKQQADLQEATREIDRLQNECIRLSSQREYTDTTNQVTELTDELNHQKEICKALEEEIEALKESNDELGLMAFANPQVDELENKLTLKIGELGRVREQLKEMTEEKNMMQGKWEEAEHERHLFKEELEKLTGEEYGIEIEGQDGDATMS